MARPDLDDLKGFTVAITADRRRDEQAVLMERLGVEVIMFPLLQTRPEDATVLRGLTEKLVQEPPDYLVANTGYGMRTWLASTAEWGLQDGLVSALGSRTAIAARGAKALGELRKAGLDAWYKAPGETLEEVVARLREEDLAGRSVVVQLHGEPPGPTLAELETAGAKVSYLPVYTMGEGAAEAAGALVNALQDGAADAVTFTAAPQVQALAAAAGAQGALGPVLDGFNDGGVIAACIGPVCAGAAVSAGISRPLVPEHPRLGSLAHAVGTELASRQVVLAGRLGPVSVSGRSVMTVNDQYTVGQEERRALRALCLRPGAWVDLSIFADDPAVSLSRLTGVLDGAIEVADGSARLLTG